MASEDDRKSQSPLRELDVVEGDHGRFLNHLFLEDPATDDYIKMYRMTFVWRVSKLAVWEYLALFCTN